MCIEDHMLILYLVMWIEYECLKARGHIAYSMWECFVTGVNYSYQSELTCLWDKGFHPLWYRQSLK